MTPDELNRSTPGAVAHRILLVEDDETTASSIKEFLERHDYSVVIARDGGQAQATFVMRKPDFVILDIILSTESGFEICERMKQTDENVPILMLSVIELEDSRSLAARVGADGYLTKPIDNNVLLRKIEEIAQIVWEKTHLDQPREERRIRFSCRCGKRFKVSPVHRGRTLTCPECGEPLIVPRHA